MNLSIVSVPSVCSSKIVRVASAQHRVEVALVVNVCSVGHVSALRGIGMLILPENGVQWVNVLSVQSPVSRFTAAMQLEEGLVDSPTQCQLSSQ